MAKSINDFGNFGRHFPCATFRAQKSSQKVRTCAAGDGAICSKKLEKLSHIMGTALKLEMARGCGLRIRLWLLTMTVIHALNIFKERYIFKLLQTW